MTFCRPVAVLLAVAATGCAVRRGVEPSMPSFELTDEQAALAKASAHYLHGLILEGTPGSAPDRAPAAFEQAVRFDPTSRSIRNAWVSSLLRRGRSGEALERLRSAAAQDSKNPDIWLDLARIAESTGEHAAAEAAYARAEGLDADLFVEARLARVRCLFAMDDDARALDLIESLGARMPDEQVRALLLYWARRFLQSAPLRADACVARAVPMGETDTARAELLGLRGDIHAMVEQPEQAIAFYRAAIQTDPALPGPALRLAARLHPDDPDGALAVLETALEHNPENIHLLASLAEWLKALDRTEAAAERIGDLYADLRLRPEPPSEAFFALYGGLLLELDRRDEAATVFRAGIEDYPENSLILNNLAYTLAEQNRDLDNAYTFARRALDLTPDHPAYLDTLGWIYYRREQFDEALSYLKSALEQMPADPVINDHVGDVLAALNRIPEAVKYWRESYRLQPDPDIAAKLRRHGSEPPETGPESDTGEIPPEARDAPDSSSPQPPPPPPDSPEEGQNG